MSYIVNNCYARCVQSSHEFSLCGTLLETPGNTGTLRFGRRGPLPFATAGRERDRDSHCGGMLADMSSYGLYHGNRYT
jgi:hypothetical protein